MSESEKKKRYEHQYDLEPCPFCGGKPYLERHMRAFIGGVTTKVALVRCDDCGARAGRYRLLDFGDSPNHSREAEQAAVNHWNARVSKP